MTALEHFRDEADTENAMDPSIRFLPRIPIDDIWVRPLQMQIIGKTNVTDHDFTALGDLFQGQARIRNEFCSKIDTIERDTFDALKDEWSVIFNAIVKCEAASPFHPLSHYLLLSRFKAIAFDNFLTSVIALRDRLNSAQRTRYFLNENSPDAKNTIKGHSISNLLKRTTSFVHCYLRNAYLRDLILSEFIIYWYFDL